MLFQKTRVMFTTFFLSLFFLFGCNGDGNSSSEKSTATGQHGQLVVQIKSDKVQPAPSAEALVTTVAGDEKPKTLLSRTVEPDFDMNIHYFRLIGSGPGDTNFSLDTLDNTHEVKVNNVIIGDWRIEVEAYNAAGDLLANGVTSTTVELEGNVNSEVTLNLLSGDGMFNLAFDLEKKLVSNPAYKAHLTDEKNNLIPLELVDESNDDDTHIKMRLIAHHALKTGYYKLIIEVRDKGKNGDKNHLVAGRADTVRIIKDQLTDATYDLKGVPGIGNFNFETKVNWNAPIDVQFVETDKYHDSFHFLSETPFTMSVEIPSNDLDAGNITYIWYLLGQPVEVGKSEMMIDPLDYPLPSDGSNSIGNRFLPGHYDVDVYALNVDGTRLGSTRYTFVVTGDPTVIGH